MSLCVGSSPRVQATRGLPRSGVSVLSLSAPLGLPAALYGAGPALHVVPVFRSSTAARVRLRLRVVSSPPERPGQPGAWRPLPGRGAPPPSAAPASVSPRASRVCAACVCSPELAPSRDAPGGCRPSRVSGRLWLDAGGLLQCGRAAVSGAASAPFPSPLPPASGGAGRSSAGLLFSGIAQSLSSANSRQCVLAG